MIGFTLGSTHGIKPGTNERIGMGYLIVFFGGYKDGNVDGSLN